MFSKKDRLSLSSMYERARFRISWWRIFLRVFICLLVSFVNAIVFLPFVLLRRLPPVVLCKGFYKIYVRILGISVRTHGCALKDARVLYIANHISYIDIAVLMSLTGVRFVSRADNIALPFFGWLMRSYGTVFVHRVRSEARRQVALLQKLLTKGRPLLIFGEGTTSDGRRLLPIKSSLFAALEGSEQQDFAFQTISLRYSLLDGVPLSTRWEPLCAWHGEMFFVAHLRELLSLHRITVEVYIHPPVRLDQIQGGRKSIARVCENELRKGMARLRYRGQSDLSTTPSYKKTISTTTTSPTSPATLR